MNRRCEESLTPWNEPDHRALSAMIEALISVIIYLLIAGLIWWAVTTVIGVIPLPEPIKTVVNVLLVVVLCLILIYALMPLLHLPRLR